MNYSSIGFVWQTESLFREIPTRIKLVLNLFQYPWKLVKLVPKNIYPYREHSFTTFEINKN